MDRSIPVTAYPAEDAKIRSSADIIESGGGNAANTAYTMARLAPASFLQSQNIDIKIKLLTKIGDDAVGASLRGELIESNVDVDSPLFRVVSGRTTSLTTIIVSQEEHSRTCIHTPGSCGELTPQDVDEANLDEVFQGVIHFHSDSRHTAAAVQLARDAKRRGITVSVDAEKDRGAPYFDELLKLADILFTNQQMCGAFLDRQMCRSVADISRGAHVQSSAINKLDSSDDNGTYRWKALRLVDFFRSRYGQTTKKVVATRYDITPPTMVCFPTS